jgi:hypothetical protein
MVRRNQGRFAEKLVLSLLVIVRRKQGDAMMAGVG